jgi:hypothetical protein
VDGDRHVVDLGQQHMVSVGGIVTRSRWVGAAVVARR